MLFKFLTIYSSLPVEDNSTASYSLGRPLLKTRIKVVVLYDSHLLPHLSGPLILFFHHAPPSYVMHLAIIMVVKVCMHMRLYADTLWFSVL